MTKRFKKAIGLLVCMVLVASITVAFIGCGPDSTDVTVTFSQNYTGAPADTTSTIEKGAKVTEPSAKPTRDGYAFKGWYTDAAATEANKYSFDTAVNSDLTLYAGWSAKYNVTFDLNYTGAASPEKSTVIDGEKVAEPTTKPTRTDYYFTGWYTGSGAAAKYDFDTAVTGNLTLYAGWAANPVVTFDYNYTGAPVAATVKVEKDQPVSAPTTEPTRTDYYFTGWYTDATITDGNEYNFGTAVTGDITLYAGWHANPTVTFDLNYDDAADPTVVKLGKGEKATEPATEPTRAGYDFDGWFTDKTGTFEYDFDEPVTEDVILYAKWLDAAVTYYTVTFNLNYNGAPAAGKQNVASDSTATEPATIPTRTDYYFTGWYTDAAATEANKYNFSTAVTADTMLYAGWAANPKVTFDLNYEGAANPVIKTVVKGAAVQKPADPAGRDSETLSWHSDLLEKDFSYTFSETEFDGWYTAGGTEYDFSAPVTGDMTLYAKWSTIYGFEAELIDLKGKDGNGYSFSMHDEQLIMKDVAWRNQGASMGMSLAYLYNPDLYLDFRIYSETGVDDAHLAARLTSEFTDAFLSSGGGMYNGQMYSSFTFQVFGENENPLTAEKIDYGHIDLTGTPPRNATNQRPFDNWDIGTISLKQGWNIIRLTVDNAISDPDSTLQAYAPLVDCLYITTDATLSWEPKWSNMDKVIDPEQ